VTLIGLLGERRSFGRLLGRFVSKIISIGMLSVLSGVLDPLVGPHRSYACASAYAGLCAFRLTMSQAYALIGIIHLAVGPASSRHRGEGGDVLGPFDAVPGRELARAG